MKKTSVKGLLLARQLYRIRWGRCERAGLERRKKRS